VGNDRGEANEVTFISALGNRGLGRWEVAITGSDPFIHGSCQVWCQGKLGGLCVDVNCKILVYILL
jgi:hypothetical protein